MKTLKSKKWVLETSDGNASILFVRMKTLKIILSLCIAVLSSDSLKGDDWVDKDNRLKGKTQQSRPVSPPEYFISKRVKA